ncbi:2748_t:CDS:10 [Diversispora eburnea]|uniref:Cation-transporting ATPase n=1 Tax=Diversispora eburnea TaxID=1213867 RepID=A0A9N8YRJ5_9GLOM|nr:2748_t:CDS:10 [Diversispora eburnea]
MEYQDQNPYGFGLGLSQGGSQFDTSSSIPVDQKMLTDPITSSLHEHQLQHMQYMNRIETQPQPILHDHAEHSNNHHQNPPFSLPPLNPAVAVKDEYETRSLDWYSHNHQSYPQQTQTSSIQEFNGNGMQFTRHDECFGRGGGDGTTTNQANQESMVITPQSSSTEGDARRNSFSNQYGWSDDLVSLKQNSNSIFEEEEDHEVDNKPLLRKNVSGKTGKTVLDIGNEISIQNVYLEEEDLNLFLIGYKFHRYRLYSYYILCILTGGILYLLFRWIPRLWVLWVGSECEMGKAEWILIKNQWGEYSIEYVLRKYYGGTISSVFSVSQLKDDDDATKFASYWKDPTWTSVKLLKKGITHEIYNEREIIFGNNLIDTKEKNVLQLLFDEILHPFYIFQVFSMILWFLDEYYYYAICILIISVTSVTTTLIDTKKTMRRLREMSRFVCHVRVFRGGFLPGDVFEISDSNLHIYPCDAILLSGDCIVNESMLTGESVPVSKLPITDGTLRILDLSVVNVRPEVSKYFLFSGTKIVRVRKAKGGGVNSNGDENNEEEVAALGMVVRTAGIGFIISAYNFIRMQVDPHLIIVRALDLITIVIPPALPTTMSIGTSFAIERLRKTKIFCISPARVNVGGKLNVMCFDKTGTLTEDGLDVLVNGELIGDPLDLKMFNFTNWILEESGQEISRHSNHFNGTSESTISNSSAFAISTSGILPTIVRPPGSKQFDLSDVLNHFERNGEGKVIS